MHIAVTGSIATDHLMSFSGRFADSLIVEHLDRVALSFLVENLQIRRGGVAANICFGLARLGQRPLLVGAVGEDFLDYRSWLERHGVDCSAVHTSELLHTARFVCTTDSDQAQIASFYAGAMSEAREIELGPLHEDRPIDLVLVSPNDPQAMVRHTSECRQRGLPFAADPSQQLAWSDGPLVRELVNGATYLFSNDYESALIHSKTGWDSAQIQERVQVRVTTHGKDGVVIQTRDGERIEVPVVPATELVDPTGVGDAFRAGFLAGLCWDLPLERCAQVGCLLATHAIETMGPQEYTLHRDAALARFTDTYGREAGEQITPMLAHLPR